MPVIRYIPQDPTDLVLQGEQLRQAVLDPNNIPDFAIGVMMGNPTLSGLGNIVTDEDALPPMNSYCEIGMLSVRRQKNGVMQQRANAGISTPCGAWVSNDWSPLLRNTVGGYERLSLAGVSRDSAGAALATCTVKIFRTVNDTKAFETTSDGSGNWSIPDVGVEPGPFYYVEYKTGSPDRAGTSLNTNLPAKAN
jgi:hypothetical protein